MLCSKKTLDFADIAQCSVAILQKENHVKANHEILRLPKDILHKIIYFFISKTYHHYDLPFCNSISLF